MKVQKRRQPANHAGFALRKEIDIYHLLERIKQRPDDYLSRPTLVSLGDFLQGFQIAQRGPQIRRDGEPPFGEFTVWFGLHHKDTNGGWHGAIKAKSSDGKRGFDQFFKDLEDYRQRELKFQCHFVLSSKQRKQYTKFQNSPAPVRLKITQYKGEKCIFVYAIWPGLRNHYQHHAGFLSWAEARHSFAKYYGIKKPHWDKVKNSAAGPNYP